MILKIKYFVYKLSGSLTFGFFNSSGRLFSQLE